MRILITNPTGRIGRRILPELLAPEFSVRVLARDPSRLPRDVLPHVDVIRGPIDDARALRRALHGVEALFWCAPSESLQVTDVEQHYERFACAGWQAIRDAGTPRVVAVSACGKGLARQAGPISGLHAMEEILNESGAAIRHLRCALFMENFLSQAPSILGQGRFCYPMPGRIRMPMTAVIDVVDVALRWLVRGDWGGIAGIAVHGPADLSFDQAADIMSRVLERPVEYNEVTPEDHVRTLLAAGADAGYARAQVEMFAELSQGIARAEPRTVGSTTPTTLAAWVQGELLPAAGLFRAQGQSAAGAENPNPVPHPFTYFLSSRGYYDYSEKTISPA